MIAVWAARIESRQTYVIYSINSHHTTIAAHRAHTRTPRPDDTSILTYLLSVIAFNLVLLYTCFSFSDFVRRFFFVEINEPRRSFFATAKIGCSWSFNGCPQNSRTKRFKREIKIVEFDQMMPFSFVSSFWFPSFSWCWLRCFCLSTASHRASFRY